MITPNGVSTLPQWIQEESEFFEKSLMSIPNWLSVSEEHAMEPGGRIV